MRAFIPIVLACLALSGFAASADIPGASGNAEEMFGLEDGRAGLAAARRGDYDEAIRLFSAALAAGDLSQHNEMLAYHNRGNAYQDAGNYRQAISDYNIAIGLTPDYAEAYYSRGRAQFALGEFAASTTDFARSVALDPADAYSVLWLHIARANAAAPDADEFLRNSHKIALADWPGPLVRLYLGETTPEQIRAAPVEGDAQTQGDRVCETAFFVGEYDLLRKNAATAKSLFQEAMKTCPYTSDERDGAAVELKRLP